MKRQAWALVAVCSVVTLFCSQGPKKSDAPTLIYWFTIDSLRADVIGQKYGDKLIMPTLTRFAQESVYFDNAYSQSSFTKISTAAMFTGLWPSRLGVKGCQIRVPPQGVELCFGLDPRFPTLSGFLIDRGYQALTHPYTTHVRKGDGLVNGFEMLNSIPETLPSGRTFVYQHILGLHAPYLPSPAATDYLGLKKARHIDPGSQNWFFDSLSSQQAEELRSYYFAEGYDADVEFESLVRRLRAQGVWDEAMVIVTADHGEEFLEHGNLQHSIQLSEKVLRVPLFVKFPKSSALASHHGQRFGNRVRMVDLFPTIRDLVEPGDKPVLDGESLLPIVRGEERATRRREVVAQTALIREDKGVSIIYEMRTLIMDDWKAIMGHRIDPSQRKGEPIRPRGEVLRELYDLSSDPLEARNLATEKDTTFKALEREYWRRVRPVRVQGRHGREEFLNPQIEDSPDREEREKELRALGYIR